MSLSGEGFRMKGSLPVLLKVAIEPQRLACSSPTAGKTAAAFPNTQTYRARIERNSGNGNEARCVPNDRNWSGRSVCERLSSSRSRSGFSRINTTVYVTETTVRDRCAGAKHRRGNDDNSSRQASRRVREQSQRRDCRLSGVSQTSSGRTHHEAGRSAGGRPGSHPQQCRRACESLLFLAIDDEKRQRLTER